MVGLIMAIIKLAWLVQSYALILSYLSGQLSVLVGWAVGTFDLIGYILPYIVSAVGSVRWLVGVVPFTFALWCWLVTPVIKLVIYFTYKSATFGSLAGFAIQSNSNGSTISK